MVHNEFHFNTIDGLNLYGQSWMPDKGGKCITCIVHGLGDHSGRYAQFAEFMCEYEIGIFAMDLRGHGRSEGRKGHVPDFNYFLSDVELLIEEARKSNLDAPIVLFGHSLGGTIVANYILKHKSKEISGAILSASWFRLIQKPPAFLESISTIISRIAPKIRFSAECDPMDLTKDPDIGLEFLNDTLVHSKASAKLYVNGRNAASWALENANLLQYPTLIYHGDEDTFTSWEASREFADKAGSLAEFKCWEGLRHEPHNEIERDEVLKFQAEWILNKLPQDT